MILNGAALDEKYATHATVGVEFYPEDFPNEIELPGCAEGHEMLSRQVVNGELLCRQEAILLSGIIERIRSIAAAGALSTRAM